MSKQGKNQHVVRRDNGWAVLGEGNSRDTVHTDTQREAIERARQIAINQESDVVIHDTGGKFRERNSYGNDPYPPKG
jgi:uncharacterized protein YdaT